MISQKTGQVATASVNEVTGQRQMTRVPTDAFKSGWDRIFGRKPEPPPETKKTD